MRGSTNLRRNQRLPWWSATVFAGPRLFVSGTDRLTRRRGLPWESGSCPSRFRYHRFDCPLVHAGDFVETSPCSLIDKGADQFRRSAG